MSSTGSTARFSRPAPPIGSLLSLILVLVALVSSLFFQKVNAEFFALSGLSLIAAFIVALWYGKVPAPNFRLLPCLFLLVFWGCMGLATTMSPVSFISQGTFWTVSFFPVVTLIVLMIAGNQRIDTIAIYCLIAVAASLAVYACVSFLIFNEAPSATFANKNNLAALQVPMFLYTATYTIKTKSLPARSLFLALSTLFIFTIGIIGSRGVLICLIVGFALITCLFLRDRWPRKPIAILVMIFFAALIASNMAGSGRLADKTGTIFTPAEAGNDRFVIWEGSLALAENAPWHGIGPGLYPMVYPQYRLDEDRSAAYFAHNDYLQFFIEAGWPSALCLLAALISIAFVSIKAAFHKQTSREHRLSILVPLMGMGAISGHSLLSFNLFLPPLLILMGLLFGFTSYSSKAESRKDDLPRPVVIILIILSIYPVMFLLDTGRSTLLYKKAEALSEAGLLAQAIGKLERAAQLAPDADIYHYLHAWHTFRQKVSENGELNPEAFRQVMDELDKAEALNPLRPQIPVMRARILETVGDPLGGATWRTSEKLRQQIEDEYRNAVAINSFYLEGRFYFARFLLQQNRLDEGLEILEKGMDKPYAFSELSVNYYRLTAEMRRILGDEAGYQRLTQKLNTALEKNPPVPERP